VRPRRTGLALVAAGVVVEVIAAVAVARAVWPDHGSAAMAQQTGAHVFVPPGAPVQVAIPAIGVVATVDPLGLRADGHVEVPADYDHVGWYAGSAVPGAAGPTVLLGHIDTHTGPAVFYRLGRLQPGDKVVVDRADDAVARFVVDRVIQFRKSQFPTADVYG